MAGTGTAWSRVGGILLVAWLVSAPPAYFVALLSLGIGRLPIALAMLGWAVASVAATVVVRLRAAGRDPEPDPARSGFRTFPQRAAFAANLALLVGGLLLVLGMVAGGIDVSLGSGAAPGLVVGVVGGFLLLAAAAPVAVVNALWTFDARTAAVERAVLDERLDGDRAAIVRARLVAGTAWAAYGSLAALLAVAAGAGAI